MLPTDFADVFQPAYGPTGQAADPVVLHFIGPHLLITPERSLPPAGSLPELGPPLEALTIGTLGGKPCEMRVWPAITPFPVGVQKGDSRQLWGHWPQSLLDALCRGRQLASWLLDHRFCSVCGHGLVTQPQEPARLCETCGHRAYPRISPVGIVLVLRGDKILLARSPHFAPGVYSALAGFVEAGESIEACLHREVREEVGIEIRNLRWFGSQPWPYPHSLMLGFLADYAGGELTPQPGEIEDAAWFRGDSLPTLPHASSIAWRMIQAVISGDISPAP